MITAKVNRSTNLFINIGCTLACLALLPVARAVNPPPDGGYPGANTAEGDFALLSLTDGTDNTATGYGALSNDTTGGANTASGSNALYSNTTGTFNTADGLGALYSNTTGTFNTADGLAALSSNTTGSANTANGFEALFSNTAGVQNTATGHAALYTNATGNYNTASGYAALYNNTTGEYNTAEGFQALYSNTTGLDNTAFGTQALFSNTTGSLNTANGLNALFSNTTGGNDTATGYLALTNNTTGSNNVANGYQALLSNTTGGSNTANGYNTLLNNATGSSNIAMGDSAGAALTTGSNNIDIGNVGVAAEGNTIRLGTADTQTATFIAGIKGTPITGVAVGITTAGQLGVRGSSARFKEAIKPMEKASETIFSLQPVTFRYKKTLDPSAQPQFGLVAEQVAKVDPDLVVSDETGKPFSVRYEEVNAMLLNEFLKEHRKVEELKVTTMQQRTDFEAIVVRQEQEIRVLALGLKAQASQLQQMSQRVARAAPRLVASEQED